MASLLGDGVQQPERASYTPPPVSASAAAPAPARTSTPAFRTEPAADPSLRRTPPPLDSLPPSAPTSPRPPISIPIRSDPFPNPYCSTSLPPPTSQPGITPVEPSLQRPYSPLAAGFARLKRQPPTSTAPASADLVSGWSAQSGERRGDGEARRSTDEARRMFEGAP